MVTTTGVGVVGRTVGGGGVVAIAAVGVGVIMATGAVMLGNAVACGAQAGSSRNRKKTSKTWRRGMEI